MNIRLSPKYHLLLCLILLFVNLMAQAPPEEIEEDDHMLFRSKIGGKSTSGQTLLIPGQGNGDWFATSSAPWIHVTPKTGVNNGAITISVNPAGLPADWTQRLMRTEFTQFNGPPLTMRAIRTESEADSFPQKSVIVCHKL